MTSSDLSFGPMNFLISLCINGDYGHLLPSSRQGSYMAHELGAEGKSYFRFVSGFLIVWDVHKRDSRQMALGYSLSDKKFVTMNGSM